MFSAGLRRFNCLPRLRQNPFRLVKGGNYNSYETKKLFSGAVSMIESGALECAGKDVAAVLCAARSVRAQCSTTVLRDFATRHPCLSTIDTLGILYGDLARDSPQYNLVPCLSSGSVGAICPQFLAPEGCAGTYITREESIESHALGR
jgi:hypothetical protein